MRAIIVATALITGLWTTGTLANACSAAIVRHNQLSREEAEWYRVEFSRVFGVDPKDSASLHLAWKDACPKLIALWKARIPHVEEVVVTYKSYYSACPRPRDISTTHPGFTSSNSPPELLANLYKSLSRCEEQLKAAAGQADAETPIMNSQRATGDKMSPKAWTAQPLPDLRLMGRSP